MENNFNNIVNILQNKKLKQNNYEDLCNNLFLYAQQKLKLKNNTLKFLKLKGEGFGYAINNEITINTKYFKLKYLSDIIDTIFHETRHLYQKENLNLNKNINTSIPTSLPIQNFSDMVYLINEENVGLNPFYLYFTSKNEKDARDYAGFETYKLLRELKPHLNKKLAKLLEKQIEQTKQKVAKNDNLFKTRLSNLKVNETSAFSNFENFGLNILKTKKGDDLKKYTLAIFSVFANNTLTTNFLNYALENKNEDVLYAVLNSPYSKIEYQDFDKSIKFLKSKNISLDTIKQNLFNWNKSTIENFYNEPTKTESVKSEKKVRQKTVLDKMTKEAKIKLYNSLNDENLEK